jgi:conjugal transfer pilus assembly protein TraW
MPALLPPAVPSAPAAYIAGADLGASLANMQSKLRQGVLPTSVASAPTQTTVAPTITPELRNEAVGAVPNLKYLLRNTIDGAPVIPPGMTEKQASMYVSHDWMARHIHQARTLVFISLSMPKEDIRRILSNIWNDKALRSESVVVVRGWPANATGLPDLVQALGDLQPSLQKQVNIAVDPSLFESYAVQRVPMVARKISDERWVTLSGDRDLPSVAVAALDAGKDAGQTRGQTWPVIEPDLIAVMNARMKAYAWAKKAKQANADFFSGLPKKAPSLPESIQGLTYFHNPSVVVTQDIRLPDGRLVAAKGQVIDPLAQNMPWQTWRAAVFNASVPWEVAQAKKWAAQYPGLRLMMTSPPSTQQGYAALEKSFGNPVYVASPLVVQRLGVTNSPALIWPRGLQLQIQVPPIPNDPGYAATTSTR